jgi:hypothetical protein
MAPTKKEAEIEDGTIRKDHQSNALRHFLRQSSQALVHGISLSFLLLELLTKGES